MVENVFPDMKAKYVGKSFGVDSLTNGKIYEVVEIDGLTGALRIIDDSGEDYLYHPLSPKPNGAKEAYGHFEIIEDSEKHELRTILSS